jgi:hypothetical protein
LATRFDHRDQSPRAWNSSNWPARTARRWARGSTFSPSRLSSAGSNVTEAIIVRLTAIAVPMARP